MINRMKLIIWRRLWMFAWSSNSRWKNWASSRKSWQRRRESRTDTFPSSCTRKKLAPAPDRTDIYNKMGKFLKLPAGKLSELAEHQREERLRRSLGDQPTPLLKEVRDLILGKCACEGTSVPHNNDTDIVPQWAPHVSSLRGPRNRVAS